MTEAEITSKVEELMKALDQVRRYRALASLLVDFGIILLVSLAALLSLEVATDLARATSGFPCWFMGANGFTCGSSILWPWGVMLGLAFFVIPVAGVIGGLVWVERRMKAVKAGEWRPALQEGFPGAVKLLTQMNWSSVFDEMRVSKLGYMLYGVIKVVGYFILVSLLLSFVYPQILSFIHTGYDPTAMSVVSLVLVLALSRNDLQKRFKQVWSMDTLMWELRWFSSELGSRDLKA